MVIIFSLVPYLIVNNCRGVYNEKNVSLPITILYKCMNKLPSNFLYSFKTNVGNEDNMLGETNETLQLVGKYKFPFHNFIKNY